MNTLRSYRLTTRLVPAGLSGGAWLPARWAAELRTAAGAVAKGEGESEREAVDAAMVAMRG